MMLKPEDFWGWFRILRREESQLFGVKVEADSTKTLVIQASDYIKSSPLYIEVVCRWTRKENPQGYYVSGFEILRISEEAKKNLSKLIDFVTLGMNTEAKFDMFSLIIIRPDGQEIEQGFTAAKTMVGRHEKCDLRLVDSMVSRNHCIILNEGKRFVVKDMESRNGTWVNGRRIKNRRSIKTGDVIQVGPFRLFFQPESGSVPRVNIQAQTIEMIEPGSEPFVHRHEAEVVVKPIGMISDYLSEATVQRIPTKVRRERLNRNLVTLYRITEELVTTKDMAEILDYIMDQIFEIFSPSQATILLRDREETPIPIKQKCTEGKGNIRPISNTIVNRILKDRVAILTDNALEDPRFEMGESVIIDGIRSVMAAPIWEDRSILGVIYVDSLDIVGGYQSEDLELLTAIGHQTALAIQRWKLTERLREEAVKSAVIRQNLSRFHSAQIVDLILEGAADLAVKETVATIFFCDIVGFTSLCESCRPQQLQDILNLFCKTVNQIVFNEQGTLDKFIGGRCNGHLRRAPSTGRRSSASCTGLP